MFGNSFAEMLKNRPNLPFLIKDNFRCPCLMVLFRTARFLYRFESVAKGAVELDPIRGTTGH
jgi:hypothetical protein